MTTAKIVYSGHLRTVAEHVRSGDTLVTDAPVDNNGKGEAFSPTDLVATALVTCMITTMAIKAEKQDLVLGEIRGDVEKVMASDPRRIAALNVEIRFSNQDYSEGEKRFLEDIALNCPVAKSIHPDIAMNVTFTYD